MKLKLADVEALLKRFTYKPNCRIQVRDGFPYNDDVTIFIAMWVLDSRQKYPPLHGVKSIAMHGVGIIDETPESGSGFIISPQKIGSTCIVPDSLENEEMFWMWLRTCISSLERHEQDEWFQVDGEPMWDPHAKQKTHETYTVTRNPDPS